MIKNNINKIVKKSLIAFYTCCLFLSCSDNFKNIIETENNAILEEQANNNNTETDTNPPADPSDNWTKKGTVATARAGAAMTLVNGKLYICGGENYNGVLNDFWEYNIETQEYNILESDTYKVNSGMCEIDGNLYIYGGKDGSGTTLKEFKYYNIASGTWYDIGTSGTTGSSPGERYSHVVLAYYTSTAKKIFVHGGYEDNGDADGVLYQLDLNITSNTVSVSVKPLWSSLNFNHQMGEHAAYIYNDKIYFFGGYSKTSSTYLNDIYVYDIASGTETVLTPIVNIDARSAMQMIITTKGMFVYGGKNASLEFNDLWIYSFTDNLWKNLCTGHSNLVYYSAVNYEDNFLMYSGSFKNNSNQTVYTNELWIYLYSE